MPQAQERIAEYILDKQIGTGASGEVWRARHHVWADRIVAIKIPTNPQSILDLQRQEIVAKDLSHPGIVKLIGLDPYANPPYIVMEYVAGTSLRPWVESRSLSPANAVMVITRLLEALSYAHARGVVHGDVKPENILVDERARDSGLGATGMIKLTDFGLGKRSEWSPDSIMMSTSLRVGNVRTVGTIDYLSPEQKHGGEIDARTDVYACGVVLYEMLTGCKPAGMEAPTELNPKVPLYLDEVFRRAYARLEKRYSSAGDFLQGLEQGANVRPEVSRARIGAQSRPAQVQSSPPRPRPVVKPPAAEISHGSGNPDVDRDNRGGRITSKLLDRLIDDGHQVPDPPSGGGIATLMFERHEAEMRNASVPAPTPTRARMAPIPVDAGHSKEAEDNLVALSREVQRQERAAKPHKSLAVSLSTNIFYVWVAIVCGAICALLIWGSFYVYANDENPIVLMLLAVLALNPFLKSLKLLWKDYRGLP